MFVIDIIIVKRWCRYLSVLLAAQGMKLEPRPLSLYEHMRQGISKASPRASPRWASLSPLPFRSTGDFP